jgi:hypothetical protein
MRIERRVAKLEQERAVNSATLMDRYWAHVDRVALRLTGMPLRSLDGAGVDRLRDALDDEFVQRLREDELDQFLAELEGAGAALTARSPTG